MGLAEQPDFGILDKKMDRDQQLDVYLINAKLRIIKNAVLFKTQIKKYL